MEYVHGGDIYTYTGLTDYSVNINPFGPGERVREAVKNSVDLMGAYPDSRAGKLRIALAQHLGISPDMLIFGNGAAELIFLIALAEHPKNAVLTEPCFAEYGRALRAAGCSWRGYRLSEQNGFCLEEDYLEMLTEDTDMIFLCSPDNPSGRLIRKDLLLKILECCREKKIRMVLDECFLDFTPDPQVQTLLSQAQNEKQLFLLRAFTKISAMPGIRLGYGVSCDMELLNNMENYRQPWSVSCIAQEAGLAALEETGRNEEMRNFIRTERKWMEDKLTETGIKFFPSDANFLLLKSPYDLFTELRKRGFLIRDCSNYAGLGKGFYRIAVKQRADNERLTAALDEIYLEGGALWQNRL